MNVIQMLRQDHERVRQGLNELLKGREDFFDLKKLDRVCKELELHMLAEEELLYPQMSEELNMVQLIRDAFKEHTRTRSVIDEIALDAVDTGRCKQLIRELLLVVDQHVEHEEKTLFPEMERKISREELNRIGVDIQEFKDEESSLLY